MFLDISAAYNMAPGQMLTTFPQDGECSLTLDKFSDLMKAHQDAQPPRPWVMAMVDDGSRTWHYFDAAILNVALAIKFENPNNHQPIRKVHYIALKSFNQYSYIGTTQNAVFPEKVSLSITASKLHSKPEEQKAISTAQGRLANIYSENEQNAQEGFYWDKMRFEMFPNDPEAMGEYAAYLWRGTLIAKDLDRAKELLDCSLAIQSTPQFHVDRAEISFQKREYFSEREDLVTAYAKLDRFPNPIKKQIKLKRARCIYNHFFESTQFATSIVADLHEIRKDHFYASYILGRIYTDGWGEVAKDEQRAEELLTQYIQKCPHDDNGSWALAKLYTTQKKYDTAAEYFQTAIALQPNDFYTYQDFGEMLLDDGKVEDAHKMLTKALELNPESQIAKEKLEACKKVQESAGYRLKTAIKSIFNNSPAQESSSSSEVASSASSSKSGKDEKQ